MTDPENSTKIKSTAYSGLSQEGLNPDHTYDRMLYSAEENPIASTREFASLFLDCRAAFEKSDRTRLLIRAKAEKGFDTQEMSNLFRDDGIEIAGYTNPGNQELQNITLGLNKSIRRPKNETLEYIVRTVQQKIRRAQSEVNQEGFESFALREHEKILGRGYSFDTQFSAKELSQLWSNSFGWNPDQCLQYAQMKENTDEKIFGIRSTEGKVLAGMLYSYGESTEWFVIPEERKKRLMVPLLLFAYSQLLRENIADINAELRFTHSISAGIQSGMNIDLSETRPSILANHVSIGGDPDDWNRHLPLLADETPGHELRSFVVAHLDPSHYTDTVLGRYTS